MIFMPFASRTSRSSALSVIICFIVVWFLITATKIRRFFYISKFFLTFFILFFIECNHTYIYSDFPACWCSSLFRLSCVPVVLFRSCSGRVPVFVVCPDGYLLYIRAYIRAHTHAHGDFQIVIFRLRRNFQTAIFRYNRNFQSTNGNFQTTKT